MTANYTEVIWNVLSTHWSLPPDESIFHLIFELIVCNLLLINVIFAVWSGILVKCVTFSWVIYWVTWVGTWACCFSWTIVSFCAIGLVSDCFSTCSCVTGYPALLGWSSWIIRFVMTVVGTSCVVVNSIVSDFIALTLVKSFLSLVTILGTLEIPY